MSYRTTDLQTVLDATSLYDRELLGFYPQEWLDNQYNVAITNEHGDVSLFQREYEKVVSGHWFFHSRGKQAKTVAKDMLSEIFTGPYNVEVIRGLAPLRTVASRWLVKQIGFKSYGVVHTVIGPCELVIQTKREWENKE